MKTLKLYWLRLISKMPQALKNLAWLLGAIAATSLVLLSTAEQFNITPEWVDRIRTVAWFTGGGLTFLQFTSRDKNIRDETPKTL